MVDNIKKIKIEAVGLKNIKKELDDIKKSMKDATDPSEMAKLTTEADRLENKLSEVNEKVKEFDLDDKFKEASSAADPLSRAIEEVTNEMKDLENASKDVGDNFEKLTNEQIATELSSVAGGFTAIATSAYALSDALGITNDDTETFVKNIGTGLAVANGFGQGLQGIISAQKLLASVTIASTTATKGGTVAMRIFNTVVKANPIGLLVTALLAAISVFAIFNSSSEDAKKNTEAIDEAQRKLNETSREYNRIISKRAELEDRGKLLTDSKEVLSIENNILKLKQQLNVAQRDENADKEELIKIQKKINQEELNLISVRSKEASRNREDSKEELKERFNRGKVAIEQQKRLIEGLYGIEKIEAERTLDAMLEVRENQKQEIINLGKEQRNEIAELDNRLTKQKIANENSIYNLSKGNKEEVVKDEKENVNLITALRSQLRDEEVVAEIQHKKELELIDANLIEDEKKRGEEILRINTEYEEKEVDALTRLNDSKFVVLDEQRKLDLEKAGNNTEEKKLIEEKFAADVAKIYRDLDKTKKELEADTFEKVKEDAEDLEETLSNLSDIILSTAEKLDSSFGVGLASSIQGISEFVALADIEFENGIDKITAYASAAANAISGILGAVQDANRKSLEATLNDTESITNEQIDLINNQVEAGVLSIESGEEAKNELNKKSGKIMLEAKKKAFEEDKKFQVAQATVSGIQGALQAFTGAMSLGPIAGPIVGGVLAAAVAGMTAVNISKIKATKFNSGGGGGGRSVPTSSAPSTPTRQAPIVNFQGTGGTNNEVNAGGGNSNITIENNVSVSETEITDKQKTIHNLTVQSQL